MCWHKDKDSNIGRAEPLNFRILIILAIFVARAPPRGRTGSGYGGKPVKEGACMGGGGGVQIDPEMLFNMMNAGGMGGGGGGGFRFSTGGGGHPFGGGGGQRGFPGGGFPFG